MSDTTDPYVPSSTELVRTHPATLAMAFYRRYRAQFDSAALEPVINQQGFYLMPHELDEFLLEEGMLDALPDSFNSNSVPRRGTVARRNEVRTLMNRAALKAVDHPPFHVGSARTVLLDSGQGSRIRVKLINHYAADRPVEVVQRLGLSAKHCQRAMRQVSRLAGRSAAISTTVRDYLTVATLAEPMLEAVEKMAARLEKELRRSEVIKR